MHKIIIAIALFMSTTAPSQAADTDRYLSLAKCMAYAAVKGGVDGKKEIPADYAAVISLLGEEYMFEATALGLSDDQAHTFVVNELMRQNKMAAERGMDALNTEMKATCAAIADEFISVNKKQ